MDEAQNAIDIAVLKEQINGLREQQKAHSEATKAQLNGMESKIDELTAVMNRGRGAYAASLVIAGAIGATALALISQISSYFHR